MLQRSPLLSIIVARCVPYQSPDAWLVAGAIAQTVWNDGFGLPAQHGIADVDIVYFDGDDPSAESEAAQSARVRDLFADLVLSGPTSRTRRASISGTRPFGQPAPYVSTADAIPIFPTTATAVGASSAWDEWAELVAPSALPICLA